MAKVPFSKLQVSINNKVTTLSYANKNGENIEYEVKYYLPFRDKISLVSNVINYSVDGNAICLIWQQLKELQQSWDISLNWGLRRLKYTPLLKMGVEH